MRQSLILTDFSNDLDTQLHLHCGIVVVYYMILYLGCRSGRRPGNGTSRVDALACFTDWITCVTQSRTCLVVIEKIGVMCCLWQRLTVAADGLVSWFVVDASLARFKLWKYMLHWNPPPMPNPETAEALSSSQSSSIEPTLYASEKASSWYSDSQVNLARHTTSRPQTANSQSSLSSFATRVIDLLLVAGR